MKKLLSCLLAVVLLLTLAITVGAVTDDETSAEASTPTEEVENADSEATAATEPEATGYVEILPNESALPEGYEIDPDFSWEIKLTAEDGWSGSIKNLLEEAGGDEYIYFIVEEEVAEGYSDYYGILHASGFFSNSPGVPTGNVIIVKNIREGTPPTYELPKSGGIGTTPFTVAGTAILLIAAAYGVLLYRRRKESA